MNILTLTKILNKLTPDRLQGPFWKRFKNFIMRCVDRLALDPILRRCLQIEFEPEVQRLVALHLGEI